jgi:hypothetical protein
MNKLQRSDAWTAFLGFVLVSLLLLIIAHAAFGQCRTVVPYTGNLYSLSPRYQEFLRENPQAYDLGVLRKQAKIRRPYWMPPIEASYQTIVLPQRPVWYHPLPWSREAARERIVAQRELDAVYARIDRICREAEADFKAQLLQDSLDRIIELLEREDNSQ